MKPLKHLLLALSLSLLPAMSSSQAQTTPGVVQSAFISGQDVQFAKDASKDLLLEVFSGRLALTNTNTIAVRRYGRRMVTDHTRDYTRLARIANRLGIAISSITSSPGASEFADLTREFNEKFDQDYIQTSATGHIEDIHMYLDEVRNGKNPSLIAFATSRLPELFNHYQLAVLTASVTGVPLH